MRHNSLGQVRLFENDHTRAFLGETPTTVSLTAEALRDLAGKIAELKTPEVLAVYPVCAQYLETTEGKAFEAEVHAAIASGEADVHVSLRGWTYVTGCLADLDAVRAGQEPWRPGEPSRAGAPGTPVQVLILTPGGPSAPATPPPGEEGGSGEERATPPKNILPAVAGVGAVGLLVAAGAGLV